jgi:hypothetical protein
MAHDPGNGLARCVPITGKITRRKDTIMEIRRRNPDGRTPAATFDASYRREAAHRIERSTGIHIGGTGLFAGGGYEGATPDLDAIVAEGGRVLAEAYGMDVTIRFNSDRESGGAFLRTHEKDSIGANAEVGICASIVTARHRAQAEASAQRSEGEARTGRAPWQREPLTASQIEGAQGCAAYDRAWLAENPVGQITILAHIAGTSVRAELLPELKELPGWNRPGYHHGPADTVTDALARCVYFVPPGTLTVA